MMALTAAVGAAPRGSVPQPPITLPYKPSIPRALAESRAQIAEQNRQTRERNRREMLEDRVDLLL